MHFYGYRHRPIIGQLKDNLIPFVNTAERANNLRQNSIDLRLYGSGIGFGATGPVELRPRESPSRRLFACLCFKEAFQPSCAFIRITTI
jgi:hypothetical protein